MSLFKKIGKVAKKVLPWVSPAASLLSGGKGIAGYVSPAVSALTGQGIIPAISGALGGGAGEGAPGSGSSVNDILAQIGPMAQGKLNPYLQRGEEASQNSFNQFKQLTSQPGNFLNDLLAGYKPSPAYDFKKNEALKAMRNSAAAGGYAGTTADQTRQGQLASALASEDMYDWLDRVLGLQTQGLQGQQGVGAQGFLGTQGLVDILANSYNQQGGLEYKNVADRNQRRQDMTKNLLSLGGTIGGALLGGPAGAAAGGAIGNTFGGRY